MPSHTFVLKRRDRHRGRRGRRPTPVGDPRRPRPHRREAKYGCGINVCKACTAHINGRAFNPCSVRVADLSTDDEITTIEGLVDTVDGELHPMQEAWLERDVSQCGYCQPGQIMAAVALVKKVRREDRSITEADLDAIRNVLRHLQPHPRSDPGGRRPDVTKQTRWVGAAAGFAATSGVRRRIDPRPGGP